MLLFGLQVLSVKALQFETKIFRDLIFFILIKGLQEYLLIKLAMSESQ